MKNWKKGGIALLLMITLNGCKAWNCGCPMSWAEEEALPVNGCLLTNDQQTTINRQPATNSTG
ncbi:MAG: hypothetical protein KDD10_19975, partial [Phaeodactylibacter sp.]|nr:hypothetical protein [Phaeodactylibacter sp.]